MAPTWIAVKNIWKICQCSLVTHLSWRLWWDFLINFCQWSLLSKLFTSIFSSRTNESISIWHKIFPSKGGINLFKWMFKLSSKKDIHEMVEIERRHLSLSLPKHSSRKLNFEISSNDVQWEIVVSCVPLFPARWQYLS